MLNKFILILLLIFLSSFAAKANELKIGSKKFTESVILGEIVNKLAISEGINSVHLKELGGTRILWSALVKGDIDLYPEYTGTLIFEIFADIQITNLDQLKGELEKKNIIMSRPFGFNNTYAIGMKKDKAKKLKIEKISDLKKHPELKFGFNNEFLDRNDGWPGLKEKYDLSPENITGIDHDLAYKALESNKIDVLDIYATDAEIRQYNIKTLADDKSYFNEYLAVIIYRKNALEKNPDLREKLNSLEGKIDQKTMINLNSTVKIEGKSESDAATDFLNKKFKLKIENKESTLISRLVKHTKDHLVLVIISLSCAIMLSIPLGIIAFKFESFGQMILGIVGIIQTIPSLALLVFMIPFFGIGTIPALAALFLYSLLPIVRNTHSGLMDISKELQESADALGISSFYKLTKIELPLAFRSILSGIKISAVINVGTATLGALIGAGGYGQPILTGIRLDNIQLILEGAIPAAVLALLIQGLFDLIEIIFIPRGLKN